MAWTADVRDVNVTKAQPGGQQNEYIDLFFVCQRKQQEKQEGEKTKSPNRRY